MADRPPVEDVEQVEAIPESLWARLKAEPERAAEIIAIAAAERFHEPARRWVAQNSSHMEPAEMARLAKKKHVRLAGLTGAATGVGGMLTVVPNVLSLIWAQCRMVFFIAASYGFDPEHPMRPAELLVLLDVYETAEEARAALDGVGTPLPLQMVDTALRRSGEGGLRKRLIRYAYRYAGRRVALRFVPLLSAPLSAAQNASAASELGDRALRYYGGA
jgi:hypothetical protein